MRRPSNRNRKLRILRFLHTHKKEEEEAENYGLRNILKATLLVFFSVVVNLFDIQKEASYVQIETGRNATSLSEKPPSPSLSPFLCFSPFTISFFSSVLVSEVRFYSTPSSFSTHVPLHDPCRFPSTLYQFLPPCVLLMHYCGKRWPLPFLLLCGLSQPASTGLHLHPSASKSTRGVPF